MAVYSARWDHTSLAERSESEHAGQRASVVGSAIPSATAHLAGPSASKAATLWWDRWASAAADRVVWNCRGRIWERGCALKAASAASPAPSDHTPRPSAASQAASWKSA